MYETRHVVNCLRVSYFSKLVKMAKLIFIKNAIFLIQKRVNNMTQAVSSSKTYLVIQGIENNYGSSSRT
jgi:hypothetical protein